MDFALWSLLIGVLLILLALSGTVLSRLPLSTAMLYLLVGLAVSPLGLGLMAVDPRAHIGLLEHATEGIVVVSLFTAGQLSPGLNDRRWLLPLRLALASMVITVLLIAAVAYLVIGLPLGAAVLLGGILAPTDPVLASDVQVRQPGDRDRLRFSLTGEGGFNDGTAFPFVLLGLGLLGAQGTEAAGWHWLLVEGLSGDVRWAGDSAGAAADLAIGPAWSLPAARHRSRGAGRFPGAGPDGAVLWAALRTATAFYAVCATGVRLRHLRQREAPAPTAPASHWNKPTPSQDPQPAEAVAAHARRCTHIAQAFVRFQRTGRTHRSGWQS